jgi:arsenate reductase-like glutaredoxin family protein
VVSRVQISLPLLNQAVCVKQIAFFFFNRMLKQKQANGGVEAMLNPDAKDQDTLALIRYLAPEDKLEKILGNPQVIKTPVVRNGKQSTLGYQPEVWKGWS